MQASNLQEGFSPDAPQVQAEILLRGAPDRLSLWDGHMKRKRISCIYVMRNKRNGYVKIGISANPAYREKTLQSEEPEIELLSMCLGMKEHEALLHDHYAAHRVRGEWFDLSQEQVDEIVGRFDLISERIYERWAFGELTPTSGAHEN